MKFARLNYILIPSTPEARERFRRSRWNAFFLFLVNVAFFLSTEGQVLFLCWLVTSVISMNIEYSDYYIAWSLLTGVLVVSLLLRRSVRLTGISLRLFAPQRVTCGEEAQFTIEISHQGKQRHQALRFERPFLPWDGRYRGRRPSLAQIDPDEKRILAFRASFSARGEHDLDGVSVRALVPLGLALGPPVYSEGVHFLVVPRIARIGHLSMEIAQKYQPGGVALASVMGESRELIGVRPYRPGDPVRDLHARTWARLGFPAVREYQQEYFTRVGVILDIEGEEGGEEEDRFEAMISLAAGITAYLGRGEILLDLLVVGEEIHQLTLGRSLGFLDQALDLLACVQPKKTLDHAKLQAQLNLHLERLSCVFFLTLRWDAPRQAFRAWIEQKGIACYALLMDDPKAKAPLFTEGARLVETKLIQEDKEIFL